MKDIIKNITIMVLSITVSFMVMLIIFISHGNTDNAYTLKECVPDKQTALRFAEVAYEAYFDEAFAYEDFELSEEDDEWRVWLKNYNAEDEGKPNKREEIRINKQNGAMNTVLLRPRK